MREGLICLLPYITHQIVDIPFIDFSLLLRSKEPVLFKNFSEDFRTILLPLECGSVILSVEIESTIKAGIKRRLRYIGWRGNTSFNLCVKKKELESLRNLFVSTNYNYNFK